MRRFVLTLLFAVLIISLNRDETWALPGIADGHLSEADLEEIIDQYNPWPNHLNPISQRKNSLSPVHLDSYWCTAIHSEPGSYCQKLVTQVSGGAFG